MTLFKLKDIKNNKILDHPSSDRQEENKKVNWASKKFLKCLCSPNFIPADKYYDLESNLDALKFTDYNHKYIFFNSKKQSKDN